MISSSRVGNTVEVEMFEVPQALPVSVAIIDPAGKIVGVNDAWQDFGRRQRLAHRKFWRWRELSALLRIRRHASLRLEEDLRDLLAGKLDLLTRIYPCHSPTEERWFFLIGLPLSLHGRSGAALLHVNLTPFLRPASARRRIRRVMRTLSRRTLWTWSPEASRTQAWKP